MKLFNYSGARAKSLDELTVAQQVHIIHYFQHDLVADGGEITLKHVKKFSCNRKVLEKLNTMSLENVMNTDSKVFNPAWKGENFIFHPETELDHDSFADVNYDSVHVGNHYQWTEEDCHKFFAGALENALETMRDSKLGSTYDSFSGAFLYVKSNVNKLFCEHIGVDHEELCELALIYKEQHDQYLANRAKHTLSQSTSEEDFLDEREAMLSHKNETVSILDQDVDLF